MPRFSSLLWRILWLHVLTLGIAAIAMPLAVYFLLNATANDFENRTLEDHAQTIADHLSLDANGRWQLDLPQDLRTFYLHGFDGFAYAVVDAKNHVLFSSLRNRPQSLSGANLANSPSYFHRQAGEAIYYGASFPITRRGESARIQIAQNLEHPDVIVDDIVTDFLIHVAWFIVPIMLLLLLTDILIVRRALKPVSQASSMARAIDPSRIDLRLPTQNVPREVLPLVTAVNQALDRLEKGFRLQREFTADAAHELRTPLAVLRARVDTLEDRSDLAALRADVEAMGRIVNQLLEVAELEATSADFREPVDLRNVCNDVAAMLGPLAVTHGKDIAVTGPPVPVIVRGNAGMLCQAVRNLAENALRHTPPGTTVEIRVDEPGGVSVLDEGPGIRPSERELIFQRFWRRERSGSGAGLGLSIVARIAEMHAGSVGMENRPGGGAVFSLSFAPVSASLDQAAAE